MHNAQPSDFDELKAWADYSPEDLERLRAAREVIDPYVPKIIDRFYEEVERYPRAAAVLQDDAQVERLKTTLCAWMREVFEGPHDEAYAARRRAIGHRHVKVRLPGQYMFTAMQLIERELERALHAELDDPVPVVRSLQKVLCFDLALMMGTFVSGREEEQLDQLQGLLVRHLRLVVLLVDHQGRVRSSTVASRMLMDGEDVLGRAWNEAVPSDLVEAAGLQTAVERALERNREVNLPRVDVGGRSFRLHIVPLKHQLASFLLQIEELTDAVEMEARVNRTEALAELGALSAAVAHELRNPLAGISGALQVITRSMEGKPQHAILQKVDGEIRRLNGLVTELLAFARPGSAKVQPVELAPIVEEVVAMMEEPHPDVRFHAQGAALVQADPNLVRQILHNLLRNAVDAIDGQGEVWIDLAPGRVQVADSGSGIDEARWEEVFKPFHTTKTRGTGLGLAISARAAHAMSGDLHLVHGSRPGATFELVLPEA